MSQTQLTPADADTLLRLATQSIARKLSADHPDLPAEEAFPEPGSDALQSHRATFVTLHRGGQLRGCCGSIRAFEPLHQNVVRSALTAAFADRRFPALAREELPHLDLHISILNPPQPLPSCTEADLVASLRAGIDGVILVESDLGRQGVFLPAVWEQLPHPRDFVRRLKQKAGLPLDYWSPWLKASRFTVESVHGRTADWLPTPDAGGG